MSASIPALLGRLSNEIILACDGQAVVREANTAACLTLGERCVGKPLLRLLTTMARPKGRLFLDELETLSADGLSAPWELLFHMARATPLLLTMRAGRLPEGGWLLVGSSGSPRLNDFYHEALTINNDLTTLVRQLSKEQALLNQRLAGLFPLEASNYATIT